MDDHLKNSPTSEQMEDDSNIWINSSLLAICSTSKKPKHHSHSQTSLQLRIPYNTYANSSGKIAPTKQLNSRGSNSKETHLSPHSLTSSLSSLIARVCHLSGTTSANLKLGCQQLPAPLRRIQQSRLLTSETIK